MVFKLQVGRYQFKREGARARDIISKGMDTNIVQGKDLRILKYSDL